MVSGIRWRAGSDDLGSFFLLAVPVLLWPLIALAHPLADLIVLSVALGAALASKRLLPPALEDLALVAPIIVLLWEFATFPLTVDGLLLAAVAGVGLLVWAGAEPQIGLTLGRQVEPALVPALAVSVALVVMFFLPSGSGGQVGIAALVLVGVLGLSGWLYLRSAAEASGSQPTS